MLMTRWRPFSELWNEMDRLNREVNRLFDVQRQETRNGLALSGAYPALNVWEDASNLYAQAELPGLKLSDLEIFVTAGNQLTIKGQRSQPDVENGVWHRQERGFGAFARLVTLPVQVDADRVEAKFMNGVLTVTMPKTAAAKPRKIAVKSD